MLGVGAVAVGLFAGSSLAGQFFAPAGGVQTTNAVAPAPGVYTLPVIAGPAYGDLVSALSIGRDDTSPFASINMFLTNYAPPFYPGLNPPPPAGTPYPSYYYMFTYRPWLDPLVPNPARIANPNGAPAIGELASHFEACDVFLKYAEKMRTNWASIPTNPPLPGSPPNPPPNALGPYGQVYALLLWIDPATFAAPTAVGSIPYFGFAYGNYVPAPPYGTGGNPFPNPPWGGRALKVNEFYKYEVVF
jgi:hypothetical protein